MHFRLEQRFAAPLAVVEAAFVDPELLAHLSHMPDLGYPELLEQVTRGDIVEQRVHYRFTGDLAPPVAALVDRDRLSWVEESTLDCRSHRQELRIVADHYADRLHCTGTVQLSVAGGGTLRVLEADLDVRFPFVGQALARSIVSGLVENAASQQRAVAEWLAEQGHV